MRYHNLLREWLRNFFVNVLKLTRFSANLSSFSLDLSVMEREMFAIWYVVLRSAVEVQRSFRAEFEFNNVPIPSKARFRPVSFAKKKT